ncbi:MAG: hypothetical protein K2J77_10295 [Oscillospiraceae bacterium]|nr:hypothetical protein [Oscillospiraceae bacterium]
MKKTLFIITGAFLAAMLFLTFFAEPIHKSTLPKITAARLERRPFPYEFIDKNGEQRVGTIEKLAVPKSMLESGVYVIYSAEKNGTERDFVQLAEIQTGEENGGFVEIVAGISFADKVAVSSTKPLYDGAEVIVLGE